VTPARTSASPKAKMLSIDTGPLQQGERRRPDRPAATASTPTLAARSGRSTARVRPWYKGTQSCTGSPVSVNALSVNAHLHDSGLARPIRPGHRFD